MLLTKYQNYEMSVELRDCDSTGALCRSQQAYYQAYYRQLTELYMDSSSDEANYIRDRRVLKDGISASFSLIPQVGEEGQRTIVIGMAEGLLDHEYDILEEHWAKREDSRARQWKQGYLGRDLVYVCGEQDR